MAITDGLVFMPQSFAAGLGVWSTEDGTPGSATYDGAMNAGFVPADQDFGAALELQKLQSVEKLRYMGQTPLPTGCYLRVSAKVKAVSGAFPTVRIAGWAGNASNAHVTGAVEVGPEVTLTTYGEVVEVSAIVGTGTRDGVDMPWGLEATYGHFGLDLTGSSGGIVRIDDIQIEDITGAFLRDMMDWVDVRDFGAVGDGVTDCHAAFEAADLAANGREILVPEGDYLIGDHLTLIHLPRFEGTLVMDDSTRLALRRGYHLNSYIDAFGDEVLAFKKAFQALLNFTDHESLDMCGRRIEIDEPLDLQAIVGNKTSHEIRRVIKNGQFNVEASSNWDTEVVTATADYSTANPSRLSNIANIANIKIGSRVTGTGVGREVYVRDVNVGANRLTLSQPLYDPAATQSYTFTRDKYVLDFSGFSKISKFFITDLEIQCNGQCSAILLAPEGETFHVMDCQINKPKDRGITSHGRGCQDLLIDRCHFYSWEQSLDATDRTSVAFNVNANDAKIRDNRFQRFGTTGVMNGNGHLIVGNHWFQGDNVTDGPRVAGLVFTYPNLKSIITGNYIDNSFIELTNEHDEAPDFSSEYSFGGLTITGNIFTANDVASWFSWIVIKPYGPGHFIQGLAVQGNTFKSINGSIDRIDKLDDSIAPLDFSRTRNVVFEGNTFNGVNQPTINPVTLEFAQNSAAVDWSLDVSGYLPFGGWARTCEAVVPEGAITNASGAGVWGMPFATPNHGSSSNMIKLTWPEAAKGNVQITARVDKPV